MSSALSDVQPAAPAEGDAVPAAWAGQRSRPHIAAFDLIRLIIMVFVVSVHALALGGGPVTMSTGAVMTVFHTSRELFLLLTALVLTYNYGHRDQLKAARFWRRRFCLVVPAYVTWSAIYYAADGRARGAFPAAFLRDLEDAGARYHLYFLLVSMQIYLLFPLIRWVLRNTGRYHAWLLCIALGYQAWLTTGLHYKVGRHGTGPLAHFLNGAGQGYWVDTYACYVVAGALAGWHFERLCAFTRRYLGNGRRVAAVAAAGVTAGIGVYLIETEVFGATPDSASAVFQPVVVFEALAFGWALLGAGLLWSDRGAPGRKFCAAGSASSFGIYLAHPLVLQVLLLAASPGYLGARGGGPGTTSVFTVLVLLFIAVPLIYAASWMIASAARRTPLSLPFTGREWKPKRRTSIGRATELALDKVEDKVTARARRIPPRALAVALAVAGLAAGGSVAAVQLVNAAEPAISTTTSTMQVGAMTRSYTVLTPAKTALPASAPIIMVLSGLNSSQDKEIAKDELTPYVTAGKAELVYPLAYRESWNAIGCCSWAARAGVNDTGFIETLAKKVDPGNSRPIYLMGYSNGGRLAYTVACTDPLLFDGIVAVKADPMPWCDIAVPQKILQVASTDDTDVPYVTGEKGNFREMPAALVQNTGLRYADQCSAKSESSSQGNMTLTTWPDCLDGSSVTFAVYTGGAHSYPRPPVSRPAASQVIWAWISGTVTVLPLPTGSAGR